MTWVEWSQELESLLNSLRNTERSAAYIQATTSIGTARVSYATGSQAHSGNQGQLGAKALTPAN